MLRTFEYRLYPTAKQARLLESTLAECCWLYNHFLEQRKSAWKEHQESLTLYDQLKTLPELKKLRPALGEVYSQVLQNVGVRLDRAFQGCFRRCASGAKPGYPRFRGRSRYDSFCFPQAPHGCSLKGNRLRLSKIGNVRLVLHRPLEGTPKTVCVRRSLTGKWFATFTCEWEPTPLVANEQQVGIDVGLEAFATFSTGEKIPNPRFFRQEEKALSRAQRRFEAAKHGNAQRRKRRRVVARVHERIAWKRRNFAHQHSHKIVGRFQVIAIEDLSIKGMIRNHSLAKSISDAAWAAFAAMLSVKAEWAGRSFVAVDPAYTSQDCSRCGYRQKLALAQRRYHCPDCHLDLDRDHNAALRVLGLGLQSLGLALEARARLPSEQPQS